MNNKYYPDCKVPIANGPGGRANAQIGMSEPLAKRLCIISGLADIVGMVVFIIDGESFITGLFDTIGSIVFIIIWIKAIRLLSAKNNITPKVKKSTYLLLAVMLCGSIFTSIMNNSIILLLIIIAQIWWPIVIMKAYKGKLALFGFVNILLIASILLAFIADSPIFYCVAAVLCIIYYLSLYRALIEQ